MKRFSVILIAAMLLAAGCGGKVAPLNPENQGLYMQQLLDGFLMGPADLLGGDYDFSKPFNAQRGAVIYYFRGMTDGILLCDIEGEESYLGANAHMTIEETADDNCYIISLRGTHNNGSYSTVFYADIDERYSRKMLMTIELYYDGMLYDMYEVSYGRRGDWSSYRKKDLLPDEGPEEE